MRVLYTVVGVGGSFRVKNDFVCLAFAFFGQRMLDPREGGGVGRDGGSGAEIVRGGFGRMTSKAGGSVTDGSGGSGVGSAKTGVSGTSSSCDRGRLSGGGRGCRRRTLGLGIG